MKSKLHFDPDSKSGAMPPRSGRNREFSLPSPPSGEQQCLSSSAENQTESKASESELLANSEEETQEATTSEAMAEEGGWERLKRHRREMAGRVWIPENWGKEELLKDWIDCSAFDACLFPSGIGLARAALAEEGRRATAGGLRVDNRC